MSGNPSPEHDGAEGGEGPPASLRREFWLLVVLFDVAILGLGLGVLLVVFEPGSDLAWPALAVGLGAGGYGYGRYRRRERRASGDGDARRQD
jgi:hypothetical protein